ncbi:DUF5518 domain-containing protein [Haloplanus rubicundus]|uniref:DUF5518 domain-containing protein n=1 Tax=Haloplanus rubicundus TaxID=1547898 RepID=A0A345E8R8_9EURY|nr:DUF5518 domain-containing protein [Haloplanus rubicundus]AXG08590.1 hypothetical protein DU484_01255 [Haloplanus rubicundus]
MVSDSTLHALIGAVVTVVFSFVPFSPVLGGGVAAYLNDADTSDGVRVGALSGLIASIPLLIFGLLAFAIFGIFTVGGPGMNGMAVGLGGFFIVLLIGVVAIAYTVGLSALGGYLGAYFVDGA